jgi:NADH-quinone oxidoreductase subunit K
MIPLAHIFLVSLGLFCAGMFGLLWQTNLLRILIAIEAMLNGAVFLFIGASLHHGNIDGFLMFLMIICVAAAEVGVALAIVFSHNSLKPKHSIARTA